MRVFSQESMAKSVIVMKCLGQSLFGEQDFWEPEKYRQSASMQRRWNANLLKQTQIHLCSKILDVGCGDGQITAQLAQSNPDREVTGVDISLKMIDFAKRSFPESEFKNLKFFAKDAEAISYTSKFDAVVSFNAIHRVPNPKRALEQMFAALRPGGHFAAVFPALGSKILTESIAAVDTRDEWKCYFQSPDRKDYSNTEEMYRAYLNNIGFVVEKVQIIWEDEIFPDRQSFFDILKACFSQKDNLPVKKQDQFFNQVMDEYLKFMPLDHLNRLHFYFNRMEIIAYKPLMPVYRKK